MRVYMVLAFVATALSLILDIQAVLPLYNFLGATGPLVSVIPAVIRYRGGFKPARIYILAYFFFTSGVIIFISSYFGLLPLSHWTFHAFQLGSSLEILTLAVALGERIRMIRREKDALAVSQRYYRHTSIIDELTGLYNRRYYDERIRKEVMDADVVKQPLSLLIMDIDHFKKFNDAYGHPQGDLVLKKLGGILKDFARKTDAPCRYGGEEFTLILPSTDLESAAEVAERIRQVFSSSPFEIEGETVFGTISIGAAQLETNESPESLLGKADGALYRAKHAGRNRVVIG